MVKRILIIAALLISLPLSGISLDNKWEFSIESGIVLPGYNTIQSPNNDTATRFSLSDSLDIASKEFIRLRLGYNISERHHLSLLLAPLSLHASGALSSDIVFENTFFPNLTETSAKYRFDSYRLTYRYDLVKSESIVFGIGLTAKIRDAEITINSDLAKATKTNTGFVPLLNLQFVWFFNEGFGVILDADAAAAKQGRAEDVSISIFKDLSDTFQINLGYRLIEGGADVEEVYSFALINYLYAGIKIRL